MELKNSGTFFSEMLAAMREYSGLAVSEGSEPGLRLMALAAQLEALSCEAQYIYRQSFPQTATDEALDHHAELRGISRRPASNAEGVVRFYTDGGATVTVPTGTVCLTSELMRIETTTDVTIPAGSVSGDAAARAIEPGEAGNIMPGSVTVMAIAPLGVSGCTNPAAFSGGGAAEDDESLRARVVSSYRSLPNGANASYYETEAMAISGVAAACAIPRPRGIGTVDVCVASPAGVPSAALLNEVRSVLADKREIAVDLGVIAPRTTAVNITAQLAVDSGYTFANVSEAARSALAAHFNGTLLAKPLYVSHLVQFLLAVDGVKNVKLAAPTVDVQAQRDLLPVLGTVTLTEMV